MNIVLLVPVVLAIGGYLWIGVESFSQGEIGVGIYQVFISLLAIYGILRLANA